MNKQQVFQNIRTVSLISASLLVSFPLFTLNTQAQTTQRRSQETQSENDHSLPPIERDTNNNSNRREKTITIKPIQGLVNIKLTNETNVPIYYQATGYTERRSLAGGQEILLRNLPLPVTVTTTRQDDGFLNAIPVSTEPGSIEVALNEDPDYFDDNNGSVLRIQKNGRVLFN